MLKYLLALFPIALTACGGSSMSVPVGRVDGGQAVHGGPQDRTPPTDDNPKERELYESE